MSDSVRPHRRQPTRLPDPWDSPGNKNGKDLTEAEEIKKRWQEYTEELYKKDLNDPDNHNDEICMMSLGVQGYCLECIKTCGHFLAQEGHEILSLILRRTRS